MRKTLALNGLILTDFESSFYDMISTINENTIHQPFIKVLLTELYKYLNGLTTE